ncbi:MAG: hypothetical protein QOE26_2733 [Verrucomicrobiota bacterium]|jgi:hypothetical protein
MENEFNPRSMSFWMPTRTSNPVPVAGAIETCWQNYTDGHFTPNELLAITLGLDDLSKPASLETVYPKFDLGHDEVEWLGAIHLVYATIDAGGKQTCRITAFPYLWPKE